jgi:hypothetical protein
MAFLSSAASVGSGLDSDTEISKITSDNFYVSFRDIGIVTR